jgi:adenosylhomocysteinase
MNLLYEMRRKFFMDIAAKVGPVRDSVQVVITHFLPDRPELLEAFSAVSPIAALVAIPYSIVPDVLQQLKGLYNVLTPTLAELRDQTYMLALVRKVVDDHPGKRIIFNEIGGYFAPFLNAIAAEFGAKVVGCVEDTQNGHVRYENARPLPYPVISVARSTLKEGEDTLVGPSCYFSTDRLMRALGVILSPRRALIVGYGKVGRGMAFSLQDNGCTPLVYDINPIRNGVAHGDGMFIPERLQALQGCDIIFGCTGVTSVGGPDFELLDEGCFLVSCSSKDVEFDLKTLNQDFTKTNLIPKVDKFTSKKTGRSIYLLGEGTPINFLDGAVFGPALTLVQAEIIVAVRAVVDLVATGELTELDIGSRKNIAGAWQAAFIDPKTGSFPY